VSLTSSSFDRLLSSLSSDREHAGESYVRIRKKLVKFFEWHGCACPDELADRTIDRVCRKVEAGEIIRAAEPSAYFHGVARNILREHWLEKKREAAALRELAQPATLPEAREHEQAEAIGLDRGIGCLERCLGSLAPESRDLILRYYQVSSSERIQSRRALAQRLGIPLNALRIRSWRLRVRLEGCVRRCLSEGLEK
jgi:DNA-directed RNA polymerase specialized sigma24 family protein